MQHLDARKVVNEYERRTFGDIFYYYGEIREARKLAREIVHARKSKEIVTTRRFKKVFSYIPSI